MNPMELLHVVLSRVFPGAETTLSTPLHEDGFWSLDFRLPDYYLSIDWREADGFGLTSDTEHGYGEGPDEVYPDFSAALLRIIQLVQNRLATVPPHPVRIRELRQKIGLSQEDVANQMGVLQAAVSKLESRDDSRVATLRNYARALGARLVLKMVFEDREEEIQLSCNE